MKSLGLGDKVGMEGTGGRLHWDKRGTSSSEGGGKALVVNDPLGGQEGRKGIRISRAACRQHRYPRPVGSWEVMVQWQRELNS